MRLAPAMPVAPAGGVGPPGQGLCFCAFCARAEGRVPLLLVESRDTSSAVPPVKQDTPPAAGGRGKDRRAPHSEAPGAHLAQEPGRSARRERCCSHHTWDLRKEAE